VDQDGYTLDIFVQSRRDRKAATRFFRTLLKGWRNGTSFGLNDLEALVSVAHEGKEWISVHALKSYED
jgi:putative transposase